MPTVDAIAVMENEAVELQEKLIQIDTTNYGGKKGAGELEAARYVAQLLQEVGLAAQIYESAPGRANVLVRIPGADRTLPALVVHGHLDVVPAIAEDWSVASLRSRNHRWNDLGPWRSGHEEHGCHDHRRRAPPAT